MGKISKRPGKLKIYLMRLTPASPEKKKHFFNTYDSKMIGTRWGSSDGYYDIPLFNSDEKLAKLIYEHCGEGTYTVCFGGLAKNKSFNNKFRCLKLRCSRYDRCRVKHLMGKRHHSCAKNPKHCVRFRARSRIKVWEEDGSFMYQYDLRRHKMKKYFAWMWNK